MTLAERRQLHKTQYKLWKEGKVSGCAAFDLFDAVGFDACIFEVVEELPEDYSKEQRLWRERLWTDNHVCVNKYRPILTDDERIEYNRQYHVDHRSEALEKMRQYRIKHLDEIAERERQYRTDNRAKINERARQYRARKKSEAAKNGCGKP